MAPNEGEACVVQPQRGERSSCTEIEKQVSCFGAEFSGHGGTALEEHDYFSASGLQEKKLAREELDLNISETELRLGPPTAAPTRDRDNDAPSQANPGMRPGVQEMGAKIEGEGIIAVGYEDVRISTDKPQSTAIPAAHERSSLAESNGSVAQEISASSKLMFDRAGVVQNNDFERALHSQTALEVDQARATFNNIFAGAKLVYPIPINAVTGTKRVFVEALGKGSTDGRIGFPVNVSIGKAAVCSVAAANQGELAPSSHQQKPQLAAYTFPGKAGNASSFTSWKLGLEMVGGSFGPFPSPQTQPIGKADGDHVSDPALKFWATPSKTAPELFPSAGESVDVKPEIDHSPKGEATVSPTRAPVGWPPVQSFRKNSLPAPHSKNPAQSKDKPPSGSLTAVGTAAPHGNPHPLFVKVYMDGLPIGRKVDLKIHNSYDKLSATLKEMFHRLLTASHQVVGPRPITKSLSLCEEKNLNFLCGSEYLITYEDKDGDLMLMGDVPWGMFIRTVKRLRIMKGCEAIGLAPRSLHKSTKCN
ncbi:hypothetical protein O6H91_16G066700 [Diphasiastrum complanatum]|uniref:Uncharacterized protein n=1 Tax=Diphasiastrum complanatum TaxID=34168 RepID=A0ACC2BDB0_DIPCM|nr:hypothetical protein O6H91_16G066700 [Diphasiastrum complanatum]